MSLLCNYTLICRLTKGVDKGSGGDGRAFGKDSSKASLSNDIKEEEGMRDRKSTVSHTTLRRPTQPETGPEKFKSCAGKGEQTCRFCGETDFLSAIVGETDALFYESIGKDCPVCGDGLDICHECAVTGFVFSWSQNRNQTASLHP